MNVLYVDLDREWRGGQSQALLTLRGLLQRKHQITLATPKNSPLAGRAAEFGIAIREVPLFGMRLRAVAVLRTLMREQKFDLIHLNEPHAMTAAWLAGARHHSPLLLSRRIGFPLRANWASRASYRAITKFIANSKDVAQSLVASGIAEKRIAIVNEGVDFREQVLRRTCLVFDQFDSNL